MTNLQRLAERVAKASARLQRAEDASWRADAAVKVAQKRLDSAYNKAHKYAIEAWMADNRNNPRCIKIVENWGFTNYYEAINLLGNYLEIRRLVGFDWSDGGRPRWRTRIIRVSDGMDIADDGAEPVLTQEQIASLVATWGGR